MSDLKEIREFLKENLGKRFKEDKMECVIAGVYTESGLNEIVYTNPLSNANLVDCHKDVVIIFTNISIVKGYADTIIEIESLLAQV